MFQSMLSGAVTMFSAAFHWLWSHPIPAVAILVGITWLASIWFHIPPQLQYYWQNERMTIHPFNVRNEIPNYVSGRIAVWRFCRKHRIKMALSGRISRSLLEFFFFLIRIPHPRRYSWEACFAGIPVDPLGSSRREFVDICIQLRISPWTRTETIQRTLKENHGYWPGLEAQTEIAAFSRRLHN